MRGRHRLEMTLQLQRQETDERERPRPSSLSSSSKSSTSKKSKQSGKRQARKRSKERKEAATSRGKMREEGNARSSKQPPQKRKMKYPEKQLRYGGPNIEMGTWHGEQRQRRGDKGKGRQRSTANGADSSAPAKDPGAPAGGRQGWMKANVMNWSSTR